jgi:DNA polymerase-4
VLFDAVRPLFEKLFQRRIRLRYLALVFDHLADASKQLSLFDSDGPSEEASLVAALDRIRVKYGESAVVRGAR